MIFYQWFICIIIGILLGFVFCEFFVGYNINIQKDKYQLCRHYNQTPERCVLELGWEKQ